MKREPDVYAKHLTMTTIACVVISQKERAVTHNKPSFELLAAVSVRIGYLIYPLGTCVTIWSRRCARLLLIYTGSKNCTKLAFESLGYSLETPGGKMLYVYLGIAQKGWN